MNKSDGISVIITTYNRENTIKRCIESIVCQTYNRFEIIIIDDGSTDNTSTIVSTYLNDCRVKYLHQDNRGVAASRNLGIINSTFEWICFVDSDDYIEKDFLEILSNNNVDDCFLYASGFSVDFFKNNKHYKTNIATASSKVYYNHYCYSSIEDSLPLLYLQSVCGKLYKKSIIKDIKLFFDESIKLSEDYLFNIFYFNKVKKMKTVNITKYHYIKGRKNNATHKYDPVYLSTIDIILNSMYKELESNKTHFLAYCFREYVRTIYHYYSCSRYNTSLERRTKLKTMLRLPLFIESKRIKQKNFFYNIIRFVFSNFPVLGIHIFLSLTSVVRKY